jgi:hypothetical protein
LVSYHVEVVWRLGVEEVGQLIGECFHHLHRDGEMGQEEEEVEEEEMVDQEGELIQLRRGFLGWIMSCC